MKYKLIAIDLDDTLLTTEKTISKRNKRVITEALDKGIKIILCSGRTHKAVKKFDEQLGIFGEDEYFITNGGSIIENMNGKIIYEKTLDNEFYRDFVDFVNQLKLNYNVVDDRGRTFTSNSPFISSQTIMQANENANGLYLKGPDQLPSDFKIAKAIINGQESSIDAISPKFFERYGDKYFVAKTGAGFLEIFPMGVNKGTAVSYLAKYLNINMDEVMVIGDRDNDVPMFKVAGLAVAMENAVSSPKLNADYITSDNNHDGVGLAIEKFAL